MTCLICEALSKQNNLSFLHPFTQQHYDTPGVFLGIGGKSQPGPSTPTHITWDGEILVNNRQGSQMEKINTNINASLFLFYGEICNLRVENIFLQ